MILLRKVKQLCFFFYSSIDDDLNVKVTDCALSRDLFPQDYCCLGDNENRPVKWMAVESLEKLRFTVASDVVSFSYNLLATVVSIKVKEIESPRKCSFTLWGDIGVPVSTHFRPW